MATILQLGRIVSVGTETGEHLWLGAGGERWYIVRHYGRPQAYVAFQVRITPEMKEKLIQRSYDTGQSQVAIVVEALAQYFASVESETVRESRSQETTPHSPSGM